MYILPTSFGEALTVAAAIALGQVLPITAVQILWVNLITEVTLSLALAFEPAEVDVMARRPRAADEPILSPFLLWRVVVVSLMLVVGTFGVFLWLREGGADLATARTAAVNTLVMFEVFYLFNVRRLQAAGLGDSVIAGARPAWIAVGIVLVFQALFTYAPFMQLLFDTRSLDGPTWLMVVAVALAIFIVVEIEKTLSRQLWRA